MAAIEGVEVIPAIKMAAIEALTWLTKNSASDTKTAPLNSSEGSGNLTPPFCAWVCPHFVG